MAKAVDVVRLLLGSTALCFSLLGGWTASASKAVTAHLAAKWPETPLLLEASEFMAEESNEKFWQFLETVQELAIYKQTESSYSYYNLILKKAGQFLDNLHINLLKFAFSIRAYSPTIQMFQQIAADEPPPDGCDAFVVIHRKHTCKINELKKLLKKATSRPRPYLFKGDHIFPTDKENLPVTILYAEIGTRGFSKFHKVLSEKARNGEILYVLRHYIQKPESQKMYLSGYGVELAIKSTEYKALDDTQVKTVTNTTVEDEMETNEVQGFLFQKLKERYSDLKDNLTAFQKYLIESNKEMTPLKVWELQDLSFQAASQIMSTPVYDAIKLMKDISQNFPIKARSLTRIAVNQLMREEIQENQKGLRDRFEIQPGDACLFINGLRVDMSAYDPFSLLDMLKLEGKMMNGLHNLGINKEDVSKFLKLNSRVSDHTYALDIRHSSVMWINDLENDDLYVTWPASCQELLKPVFPGTIPSIRRNFHNLVLFIDPAQEYTLDFIKLAELFYYHKIPLRIGFVFIVNTDDEVDGADDAGVALWRAFNYIAEERDVSQAFISIVQMYQKVKNDKILTVDNVKSVLLNLFPDANIWDILGIHSKYDNDRKEGASFYEMTGLGPLPQALYNGELFKLEQLNSEELETNVLHRMMDATINLQREVFMGTLNDRTNVIDFLMEKNNVVPRVNPLVLHTKWQYLNLISTSVTADVEDFSTFFFLDSQDKSAVIAKNMYYLTQEEDDVISSVTLWIIADFDKPSGRKLLLNALKFMKTSVHSRLGVIYNPTSKINEENTAISRGVLAAFLTQKNSFLRNFLRKLAKEETATAIYSGEKIKTFLTEGMDKNAFEKKYNTVGVNIFRTHQLFCQDVLKLRPGEIGIVSNGKFLGPLDENFYTEDFYFLEKTTFTNFVEKIKGIVENMDISSKNMSDLVMKVDALLSSLPKRASRHDITFLRENHSIITINPEENDMFFDVIAIVDPLTREAQKMAQLLIVLGKIINMKIKLFMNCRGKLSEAPLKSFYRFVLEPELVLVANGITGPVATFLDIPEAPLLTLNMITPEGWLVETVHSNCDLDNIHLKDVERTVTAEYELEYLLLEGHCFDTVTEQPPRGLQFTLGTKNTPVVVDTIVMASLGYFQLKANPGAWILKLRQGKSEDIYQIVGHEGTDSQPDLGDVIVVISSFKSKILEVQVQKKPDKIKEDILTDKEEKKKGMWDSIKSFTRRLHKEKDKKEADVLNIFSVASGHLYERFLRIMMLSVLRNTKTPVKFWFLKNYLSPTFKEVIPHMAEEYGFQYELVQYRWPSWLHQQTEKQRIIWGYKILFLDVLFPLAVDKIIFVDADQIVRHDLKELRDFDLGGAPYGYTPFCDSRTEMDGYRFWKKGYWASHLLKRKYHISALYVVDLKKFRRIAAGDRLRGQYQALSQDPNSLSNLDQDLPNNMIYQVAIKSLPQDWLWCETWCDDDSKQRAKTIDLCNNPKTKEPKLKAAARIVPEWVEYDTEIRQLLDHLENKKKNAILTHDEL
ncbi:UDP-glucose:glycoprotein glucosyltransferase 2 isoform X1 [Ursus arctos]|uniref:UDP-glucose:glycoprotein glucosyltransferase 2 isoform X1 n=1 Tax=Ursus arctos TaxID=9644 RepID=UPI0025477F16|nr:UDP-glucose:glycoprotein glucosyltransferase 2 isoform X1 [Ursus arctos]XP_057163541.1 UDP-glucose:glycoprotein glucosyltransferase 2 isoform X1 [Ursus arctos]XP_057163557.1 UDP-glucose:glycoprotein glucosyltransferase 2 isoform X1 [Ursus arctos]